MDAQRAGWAAGGSGIKMTWKFEGIDNIRSFAKISRYLAQITVRTSKIVNQD